MVGGHKRTQSKDMEKAKIVFKGLEKL